MATAPAPNTADAGQPAPQAVVAAAGAEGNDPFAGGADSLAVEEDEAGQSLRARLRLARLKDDEVMVRVVSVDDTDYPVCKVAARVLAAARHQKKHLRLLGRGRTYRFVSPGGVDSAEARGLLGLCYYPPGTVAVVRISGVDLESRVFRVSTVRR